MTLTSYAPDSVKGRVLTDLPMCAAAGLDPAMVEQFLAGTVDAAVLPEPKWGPLGKVVYERTYARSSANGKPESWADTCRRVVLGNMAYAPRSSSLPDEEIELFAGMYGFVAIPGGRHLWVTGTQVSSYRSNCWVAGWEGKLSAHFHFLASRLFEGGGVGANYSHDLMAVTDPVMSEQSVRFYCPAGHGDYEAVKSVAGRLLVDRPMGEVRVVPDSREGWIETWAALIDRSTMPYDSMVTIDVSQLRPHGQPLRTFGGRSSGPGPFVSTCAAMVEVLNGAAGRQITPFEAMEIDHIIASSVVAGGARRSARMSMMHWADPDIFAFIHAKTDPSKHWTTNISVEVDDDFRLALEAGDPHAEKVMAEVAAGMVRNGEPGLVDTSAHSRDEPVPIRATNPCLTGDTRLLTRDGLLPISMLAGCSFDLWNGREWSRSTAWYTGRKPVLEISLSSGQVIRATEDHRFATAEDGEVAATDLLGCRIAPLMGDGWDGLDSYAQDEALLLGFLQGDGTRRGDCRAVSTKCNEPEVAPLLMRYGFYRQGDVWYAGVSSPAAELVDKAGMLRHHLTERVLPDWLFSASTSTVKSFLRGLFSANGTTLATAKRVVLKTTCAEMARGVQMLLAALSIRSYITTNKPSAVVWPNGVYESAESYDLNVAASEHVERFQSEIGFLHSHKNITFPVKAGRQQFAKVVAVTPVGNADVYDFAEPKRHWGWANGLQAHNCGEIGLSTHGAWGESCNLGSINLDATGTDDGLTIQAIVLLVRFLLRSTLNPHPHAAASHIESGNRRLGLGPMGLQGWAAAHEAKLSEIPNRPDLMEKLAWYGRIARMAANDLASTLGIPEPVKVTAVAPTGTISQLPGTTPGIHPVYARYFVRRVRYTDSDPLLERERANGHPVLDDLYAAHTKVVEYKVRDSILDHHPEHLVEQADEIGVDQFVALMAAVQSTFCGEGIGSAISATCQIPAGYDPADLERSIRGALGMVKGLTVFPQVSRPLSPYEPISRETWEAAAVRMEVGDSNSGECAGGACPIR